MTTSVEPGSATIYQFPARGRYAARAGDENALSRSIELVSAPSVVPSSGWYHDAAIEAERASGN